MIVDLLKQECYPEGPFAQLMWIPNGLPVVRLECHVVDDLQQYVRLEQLQDLFLHEAVQR